MVPNYPSRFIFPHYLDDIVHHIFHHVLIQPPFWIVNSESLLSPQGFLLLHGGWVAGVGGEAVEVVGIRGGVPLGVASVIFQRLVSYTVRSTLEVPIGK